MACTAFDARVIRSVYFTDFQVAWTGLTGVQAEANSMSPSGVAVAASASRSSHNVAFLDCEHAVKPEPVRAKSPLVFR